jgi:hypothetical protein
MNEQVPTFCRHNHLIQNCPICAREQHIELRPVLSSGSPRSSAARATPARERATPGRTADSGGSRTGNRSGGGLRVRQLARGAEDGYRSSLAPGLRSSADADRLAQELAFAAGRLARLQSDPPALYATVGSGSEEIEERTWLAFLIAYLCPVEDDQPFAEIERLRTSWSSGESPDLSDARFGPRGAQDQPRSGRTLEAYRAWAARAGSQAASFTGEASWTPERRFARTYERLALPGLDRAARFDLLVTLGRLGVYELRPATLALGGDNQVTLGAKRVLGIGDSLLLDRRAIELARACELPLEALDLGLDNWQTGTRATLGLGPDVEPAADALASARAALGL